jgi:hypothetical protein
MQASVSMCVCVRERGIIAKADTVARNGTTSHRCDPDCAFMCACACMCGSGIRTCASGNECRTLLSSSALERT